jgi:nucleoside-diphosphate-sugar epimerase
LSEKEFIMRCFITGVSGFIGSAVAEQLLAKGHTVSGLTSDKTKWEALATTGIKPLLGDIRQPQHWVNHLRDVEAVIHLATLPIPTRPGSRYVRELLEVQKLTTGSMLEAVFDTCKAFIYTSGISVYGARPGVHDESAKLDPCRIAQPYAAGEQMVLQAVREKGIPGIILRPAGVYGFGGVFGRFWSQPMLAGKRTGIPGNGKQMFSFVHVEDCARAFVRCIEDPIPGEIFNVADDEPIPLGTMIRSCSEVLKAPAPFNIPPFLFKLMAGSVVGELLLYNKTASNRKMIEQLKVDLKYPTFMEGIAAMENKARKTSV